MTCELPAEDDRVDPYPKHPSRRAARADKAFENPDYSGVAWFFVRAPDGNIYLFQQAPD
jgi:hypothetical protein